ncbi:MAG: hypothetical protein U5J98_07255 [Halobacteriales archaeon]|nr:hypothetical protein [Halobacteriales archaeon]
MRLAIVRDVRDGADRLRRGLDVLPPIERELENGTLREVREFRGLTLEQAVRYLERLGGRRVDDGTVVGDGWRAQLTSRRALVGPSYRLTEVRIDWRGDQAALEPVIFRFRLKAFRAPG